MPAGFSWKESNGVGEVESTASNINFGSTDAANLSTTAFPIVRPNNSFAKYIRAKFTGTWTTISNMKFWKSAGAYVTGELIVAGFNATYATPSETTTGDSAVPTAEPSQNVNSFEGNATIVYGASGVSGYTGYIRLQLQMTSGTPSGAVNQKTFICQYDEV